VSQCNKNPARSITIIEGDEKGSPAMRRLTTRLLLALCVVLSLGFSVVARPQDAKDERRLVIGSVYRIVRNLIEVKEEGAGIAVIRIDSATTYMNSSTQAPAKLKDIALADQVVIKVVVKDGIDTAEQVRFVPGVTNKKESSTPR
jgi:hypothetical protein